jgi:very-short-patch-repair endonuclease
MALQRTFEINHLRDYLRSAEGIHRMFEQLGYDVYEPEAIAPEDIDMQEEDAQHVQAVYLVNSMNFGHTIWLFEVDDTTTMRLRGLAYDVLQRAGTHTLIVTRDYREIIIAHPYFVGGTSKSHTRVNKLKIDSRNPTRHDVDTINALLARDRRPEEIYKSQDEAFNVTRVTNKFYKEYRDYFHRTQDVVVEWNKGIREFQNGDQRDKLHAFVQRLMGRLMFLYFLQRKGWLGGRSDFLTWQYKQMIQRHAGDLHERSSYYYREVLEPLFFETLNRRRPENWTQWGVEIPYLNGGLFDQSRDPQGIITLPDSLFDPNSNTGLLAFFNRYNFTITDDTPMEQDVAVDPEMLGKVFENMLEEEDRGQSGSFYTPRTIVSYMCQEALAGYLEETTKPSPPPPLPNAALVEGSISREQVRQLFDPDSHIRLTEKQAKQVSDALDTLTVLDPAVGSGSFLIGMLNEIITLRKKCYVALHAPILNPSPNLRETPILNPSPNLREGLIEEAHQDAADSPSLREAVGEGDGGWGHETWHIPPELERRMQAIARELRKNPTPTEAILWQAIRKRQLDGRKFRRQMAIGAFVVDFYCASERLAVEVDGAIHQTQQDADRERQKLIESLGIRFVRVSADEVEQNLHAVLEKIRFAFHFSTPEPTIEVPPQQIAAWKEQIIRDTLYGVDIKPGAIEIAQLRLWLSLVVNQTMADARTLPNLDYKLMAGNSLIETIDGEAILTNNAQKMLDSTAKPQQLSLIPTADEETRKLADLRAEYFHADPERRKQLAADVRFQERNVIEAGLKEMREHVENGIVNLEKKYRELDAGAWKTSDAKRYSELLAKAERLQTIERDLWDDEATLPFFLYRLHFNDVFARKGGFDVVVANPPYVRGDKLGELKDELKESAVYKPVYSGTADLYVYFYARALDLLKEHGNMAFITSNKFIRAKYGTGLRAYLADHANMREMIDFGELPVFKEAATFPYILLADKDKPAKKTRFTQVEAWGEFDSVRELVEEHGETLPETAINKDDWTLTDRATAKLLQKLANAGMPLGKYVNGQIYRGIITGFNTAFVIDSAKRDELIAQDPKSAEIIKPYAVGDDVRKWKIHQDKWLIVTQIGVDIARYPAIFAHLSQWRDKLEVRYDQGNHWWELRACAYYEAFEKPKIVYPDIAKELRFSFDTQQTYFGNTVYILAVDDLYLVGLLNSKLLWHYVKANFAVLGDPNAGGRFRFFTQSVEQIPIPDAPDDLRQQIAILAQQCLDAAALTPESPLPQGARGLEALEAQLNQLVYQAYGLDEDDIRVIESHLAGQSSGGAVDDPDRDEE